MNMRAYLSLHHARLMQVCMVTGMLFGRDRIREPRDEPVTALFITGNQAGGTIDGIIDSGRPSPFFNIHIPG
jgi:hypothetical protein